MGLMEMPQTISSNLMPTFNGIPLNFRSIWKDNHPTNMNIEQARVHYLKNTMFSLFLRIWENRKCSEWPCLAQYSLLLGGCFMFLYRSQVHMGTIKSLNCVGENWFFGMSVSVTFTLKSIIYQFFTNLTPTLNGTPANLRSNFWKLVIFSMDFENFREIINVQKIGPSSLNIHICWVGVIWLLYGSQVHRGTINSLNQVGKNWFFGIPVRVTFT